MADIKVLFLDVDGTLTDGKIYMSENGELMKAFNIKDGYALATLHKHGITPVIITGRKSGIVKCRCEELGISEIYQGVEDKISKMEEVIKSHNVSASQCAYIGDDLNDEECMKTCGLTAAPADAVKHIRNIVDYVCECKGGEGAVREFCDYITNINQTKQ